MPPTHTTFLLCRSAIRYYFSGPSRIEVFRALGMGPTGAKRQPEEARLGSHFPGLTQHLSPVKAWQSTGRRLGNVGIQAHIPKPETV